MRNSTINHPPKHSTKLLNSDIVTDHKVCDMKSTLAITAVLTAAALMAVFSTTTLAFADESETNTEQKLKQKNVGSGESFNSNCGTNQIDTIAAVVACAGAAIP